MEVIEEELADSEELAGSARIKKVVGVTKRPKSWQFTVRCDTEIVHTKTMEKKEDVERYAYD